MAGSVMNATVLGWMFFRCLRWLFWLSAAAYYLECRWNRADHINQFGQLSHTTEFWLFGLPTAAVFTGFFELILRERAGLARPDPLRDWFGRRQRLQPSHGDAS